eukprot:615214-Amphidinium_carterae.1
MLRICTVNRRSGGWRYLPPSLLGGRRDLHLVELTTKTQVPATNFERKETSGGTTNCHSLMGVPLQLCFSYLCSQSMEDYIEGADTEGGGPHSGQSEKLLLDDGGRALCNNFLF